MQSAALRNQPMVEATNLSNDDSQMSGVSWGAILAGATGAAVLSIILFILGFGLGLSVLSPWRNIDGSTFAWTAVAWVAFTQIAASGLGGYLAGRLRVKWARVHDDEVYFRDTAHGFLAWALASLLTVAVFSSSTSALIGGTAKATGAIAASAAITLQQDASEQSPADIGKNNLQYYVDSLFRSANVDAASVTAPNEEERAEMLRIFSRSLMTGDLNAADKTYIAQLSARHSGLSPAEAEARVTTIYNEARSAIEQAKAAADKARKASAYTALWMFVALLCGAFVASLCATWGGKQRDSFSLNY